MNLFIALIIAFAATACGAGFANQSSRSSVVYDDGVTPPKSVTVTHRGRGNAASVGLPPLIGAGGLGFAGFGGYGAAMPVMAGGDMCRVHPDYCGVVVTAPVSTIPDLERRVGKVEDRVEKVEGQTKALGASHRILVEEGRKTNARVGELEKRQEVLIKIAGRSYRLDRAQCLYLQQKPEVIEVAEIRNKAVEACNEILGVIETTEGKEEK